MGNIALLCRTATPFTTSGELDEEGLRWHLNNLAQHKIGLYLNSGGIAETYAMTLDEQRRVYEIAVEECKGKVPIYANFPEQHTAKDTLIHSLMAIEAGCELINIYPIAGWHGMRPSEEELRAYYDTLLTRIKHPVALAVNAVTGYMPPPKLMAEVIHKYPQVTLVNLNSGGEEYLVNLKALVKREIQYNMPLGGILSCFDLGASGLTCPQANVTPRSYREFVDHYERKEFDKMAPIHAGLVRFKKLSERWHPGNVRWVKMAWKILKLPGGEGGVREPYVLPAADQIKQFEDAMPGVGLPELDELLRAAKSR